MTTRSYRDILVDTLATRRRKNPRYSQRSLARDLDVSNAFLSQVISGKRYLSEVKAHQIVERLGVPQRLAQQFVNSSRCAKVAAPSARARIQGELKRRVDDAAFSQLSEDALPLIGHWLSFALVELLGVESCVGTPVWLARRLGVSEVEVSVALERLVLARLVVRRAGRFARAKVNPTTPNISSAAIRRYHESILVKASEALRKRPFAERDMSAVTMCIDPTKIPEAKQRIQDFRRELMEFLESGPGRQVYVMSINLFRLDKDTPA
jgi:uncharacterized protein (TIGR02147 family)